MHSNKVNLTPIYKKLNAVTVSIKKQQKKKNIWNNDNIMIWDYWQYIERFIYQDTMIFMPWVIWFMIIVSQGFL